MPVWLMSLLVGIGLAFLSIPVSKETVIGYQICIALGVAILGILVTYVLKSLIDMDPTIRKILFKCKSVDIEQKAKIAVSILFNNSGQEVKITVNTNFKEYIKFLTEGVKVAKESWASTYLLKLEEWEKFGNIAKEYNDALKASKIYKVRYIIQPGRSVTLDSLDNERLIRNSLSAGIEVWALDSAEIPSIESLKQLKDFALLDDKLVICGDRIGNKNILPETKLKVILYAGETNCSLYSTQLNDLSENKPVKIYKAGGTENGTVVN